MKIEEIEELLTSEGFNVTKGTVTMNDIVAPKLSVLLELEGGKENEGLNMDMLFVPGVDDELNGCRLLQLFIVYSESIEGYSPERIDELAATLSEFNFNAPLGAFGIRPSDQMLFYKHMMMLPSEMSPDIENTLSETVWLITFVQNQCFPTIATILEGE